MSKLTIILCAAFLVSAVSALDADAIKKCEDSIEDASTLIMSQYAALPEPETVARREELYELAANGGFALDHLSDEVSTAVTLEVVPVSLSSDYGDVTIHCTKEIGDSVVNIVKGTIKSMESFVGQ